MHIYNPWAARRRRRGPPSAPRGGREQGRGGRARAQGPGQGPAVRGRGEGGQVTRAAALPDAQGHFGRFGGRFVPETLMAPLVQLERGYPRARRGRPVPGGPAPP